MGLIRTSIDEAIDLTTNVVEGEITAKEITHWIVEYFSGTVTKMSLWDFSEVDLTNIDSNDLIEIAEVIGPLSDMKAGGKAAFVFKKEVDYGLGRMFISFAEIEKLGYEIGSFRNKEKALKWLGIS